MPQFTLHELACLQAVVSEGSFQAAAQRLGRTHPSVHAAVGNLERQLGVSILDRSQYRVGLTDHGRALMAQVSTVLDAAALLEQDAQRISTGEEAEFDVTLGDLCPVDRTTRIVVGFFEHCRRTRLNIRYGAIAGPWEALIHDAVDVIFHHVEKEELRIESLPIMSVSLVPVVAPHALPFPKTHEITPQQMAMLTQCILRDSAKDWPERNYHVLPGAPRCTAADQAMKKELIVSGFAWGHLPPFLIEEELASGQLVSIAGTYFPVREIELCAARRVGVHRGPVAARFWTYLEAISKDYVASTQDSASTL